MIRWNTRFWPLGVTIFAAWFFLKRIEEKEIKKECAGCQNGSSSIEKYVAFLDTPICKEMLCEKSDQAITGFFTAFFRPYF